MGYTCHHAMVITGSLNEIKDAHEMARILIGEELLTEIIKSPVNYYHSFFICPDGSKEGWDASIDYEEKRNIFIEWLKRYGYYTWALIQYGDDEDNNLLLECS